LLDVESVDFLDLAPFSNHCRGETGRGAPH
jgi:hypothetical protein